MFGETKSVIAETVLRPILQERLEPVGATVNRVTIGDDSFHFGVNVTGLMGELTVTAEDLLLSPEGTELHVGALKTSVPLLSELFTEQFREPCTVDAQYAPVLGFRNPGFFRMAGLALHMMRTSSILLILSLIAGAAAAGVWVWFNHI